MPHLTYTQCVQIQVLLNEAYSHREIALKLNRSNKTISQEIKKHNINWIYLASTARLIRKTKRNLINTLIHTRIIPSSRLESYIHEKIHSYWSPEQIAWRWKRETWESVSKDTIYAYIYNQHPEWIKKYLRRKWKKYLHHREKVRYILNRKSISERPEIIWWWHREWDTIRWRKRKWWFATFNEIESWYLLAWPLLERKAVNVTEKARELFKKVLEELKKTITLDNWREFVEHFMMKEICWLETYFADPGNPWQRWANENTNGLLRQRYPKWVDLWNITQEELDYYVHLLNNRPRKRLYFQTPIEFLSTTYCVLLI
jgi:IS30 family transposase